MPTRTYRPFTPADDQVITQNRPAADVAAEINRSVAQVYHRRHNLKGGTGVRPRQAWDQAHDKAITAPDRPADIVLAAQLNRSVVAIQVRRSRIAGTSNPLPLNPACQGA